MWVTWFLTCENILMLKERQNHGKRKQDGVSQFITCSEKGEQMHCDFVQSLLETNKQALTE